MYRTQAEQILQATVDDENSLDQWTAVRCLAYYGKCDSRIVVAIVRRLFSSSSEHLQIQAAKHLIALSEQSVQFQTNVFLYCSHICICHFLLNCSVFVLQIYLFRDILEVRSVAIFVFYFGSLRLGVTMLSCAASVSS